MKSFAVTIWILFVWSHWSMSQDLPGLNYCLLFDSQLEKEAFQQSHNGRCDPLIFLLADDPAMDSTIYASVRKELSDFSAKLISKRSRYKDDLRFLKYFFYKVHSKYLKNYEYPESFNSILENGSYNCVSATALYACLLDQLGYQPQAYETRFHAFLTVRIDTSVVLFETTDPMLGFVSGKEAALNQLQDYLKKEEEQVKHQWSVTPPFNSRTILNQVSLKELAGLNYYNKAVNFYNRGDYTEAFRALKKAGMLYPRSQRIQGFLEITCEMYEAEMNSFFANR